MQDRAGSTGGQPFFDYFVRSFRVTLLLIVGLGVLGTWTVLTLPRESTPEVTVPVALVTTVYPGASARDVEELVTVPLEEAVLAVTGAEAVQSSSRLGSSSITVEFAAEEDLTEALRALREAVSSVTDLPAAAEEPRVQEISFTDEPIVSLSLGGADERLLAVLAEELASRLEDIPGVASVEVIGARDEEVRVAVDPEKLAAREVSIVAVQEALRAANLDAPLGQFETERFAYDVRLVGGFTDVGDVVDLPVAAGGQTVPLSVLAQVELGLAEQTSFSRVSIAGRPSEPAVTLAIRKKTGGNIVRIIDEAGERVAAARGELLPAAVTVVPFADRAFEIRRSLTTVAQSGVQTFLIVFGLLWLFLGWRAALLAALAVPLSFALSFLVFEVTGTTLNNVSLFSLVLSLGLLVDTAIVIVEGIVQQRDRYGREHLLAGAAEVVRQFKRPLAGGVLTTVVAFVPMLLVSGIIGEFLRVVPIVVSATLLSSLLVALTLLPAVTARLLSRWGMQPAGERWFDRLFERWRERYVAGLWWAMGRVWWQRSFVGVLVVLLVAGLSLPVIGVLPTGLFPAVDVDFMIVNVELPPGARLGQTDEAVRQVEEVLRGEQEIESYVATVGSGTSLDLGGGAQGTNLASFFINLRRDRARSSLAIVDELRVRLREVPSATITVEEISAGPPAAAPVELRVVGEDLTVLDRLSQEVMGELAAIPGALDVDRSLRYSAGEFSLIPDHEALARYGLSAAQVAQLLRSSIFGQEATAFLDEQGEEVAVRVEALGETVNSIDDVLALPLVAPSFQGSGNQGGVLVGEVVQVALVSSVDAIRHRDGERAIAVTASAKHGTRPNAVAQELRRRLAGRQLPAGYRVEFGGEQQETAETFAQLYRSMVVAIILIVLILVVEFDSYLQPLLIFLSIPLALVGVLFGLLVTGGALNFAAFIGLVSLTGIVVNNAILLVDRANNLVADGVELTAAAVEAARSRLRPILLTTLTTAAGVLPLVWVDEFFRDMALTLITGLLFSTVITLVLVPLLYVRLGRRGTKSRGGLANRRRSSPVP